MSNRGHKGIYFTLSIHPFSICLVLFRVVETCDTEVWLLCGWIIPVGTCTCSIFNWHHFILPHGFTLHSWLWMQDCNVQGGLKMGGKTHPKIYTATLIWDLLLLQLTIENRKALKIRKENIQQTIFPYYLWHFQSSWLLWAPLVKFLRKALIRWALSSLLKCQRLENINILESQHSKSKPNFKLKTRGIIGTHLLAKVIIKYRVGFTVSVWVSHFHICWHTDTKN